MSQAFPARPLHNLADRAPLESGAGNLRTHRPLSDRACHFGDGAMCALLASAGTAALVPVALRVWGIPTFR